MTRLHRLQLKPTLTALLAVTVVASLPSPAQALHPAPFPHRHVREEVPEPPQPEPEEKRRRPRRDVEEPHYLPSLYLGVGAGLAGVVPDGHASSLSTELGAGGGFELFLGWRLNEFAAVDLEWMSTFHRGKDSFNSGLLSALNGIVRVYLMEPDDFEPYALVGVGLFLLNRDGDSLGTLNGPGFVAGAGLDWHLNRVVTLGAKAMYRGAYLDFQDGATLDPLVSELPTFIHLMTLSAHVRLNF